MVIERARWLIGQFVRAPEAVFEVRDQMHPWLTGLFDRAPATRLQAPDQMHTDLQAMVIPAYIADSTCPGELAGHARSYCGSIAISKGITRRIDLHAKDSGETGVTYNTEYQFPEAG